MQRLLASLAVLATAVALAGLVTSCSRKKPSTDSTDPANKGAAQAVKARPKKPAPDTLTHDKVAVEARAALDAWVATQNTQDFDGYLAMYHPQNFKGVKRTANGKVRRYDLAGWKTDRGRMFTSKPTVAAEEPRFASWLEPGSKLQPGVLEARFTQRWKNASYADHGIKVLLYFREPTTGRLRIIYEDLLNSEPGWDRSAGEGVAKLPWTAPASDKEALALWQKLAPTGATYQDRLAALPEEVVRPMARALLGAGNFQCDQRIEYSQCGEDHFEWTPLDDKAGIDSPCLRRRLALWAIDQLDKSDFPALEDALAGLIALDEPDDGMARAVLGAAGTVAAADPVRLALLASAIKTVRDDLAELAEASLDGLSDASLITAARELALDNAARALDPARHRTVLVELLGDDKLEPETRMELLDKLTSDPGVKPGQDLIAALVETTSDDHCELAFSAAETLADLGKPEYLPRWSNTASESELVHSLCMLVHDGDSDRKLARWKEFIHPADGVAITEEIEDDFAEAEKRMRRQEAEENGEELPEDEDEIDDAPKEIITRRSTSSDDLLLDYGEGPLEGVKIPTASGSITFSFTRASDGSLYLSGIHTYTWNGCPC